MQYVVRIDSNTWVVLSITLELRGGAHLVCIPGLAKVLRDRAPDLIGSSVKSIMHGHRIYVTLTVHNHVTTSVHGGGRGCLDVLFNGKDLTTSTSEGEILLPTGVSTIAPVHLILECLSGLVKRYIIEREVFKSHRCSFSYSLC